MKTKFNLLCVVVLLWLAGCASTPTQPSGVPPGWQATPKPPVPF